MDYNRLYSVLETWMLSLPEVAAMARLNNDELQRPRSAIFVCLFTDLVGSTAWKRMLLDQNYTQNLLIPHDKIFRDLLSRYEEAEERANTGDGFLATFKTASTATEFALRFHHALYEYTWSDDILKHGRPATRIGIHLGEIIEFSDITGVKVSGQAIDLAARVMSLGDGGYTIVTRHAFDSSRQHMLSNPVDQSTPLVWVAYGRYRFKGNDDDPIEVFGVAPQGSPTLKPPGDSEKAQRVNLHDDVGSWRPASGQLIPNRQNWLLEKQLGEGGFGEVWLAQNSRTKERRVFKFCFDIDRLRSFKRELTLFRLLQSQFGNRPDFVRLIDVQFEEPPYCIESEHIASGNLLEWLSTFDIANWPIEDRVRFVADVAESVAVAHSLNIIHKDLKPSNILVRIVNGKPVPVIADFGIGVLTDQSMLVQHNITVTGGINTLIGNESSRTGTRIYAPPESMFGKPATTANDVYALGVMLYQLVIGDMQQALGTGWEEKLPNDGASRYQPLKSDIREATQSDPSLRLQSVEEFAKRLRQWKQRTKSLNRRRAMATFFLVGSSVAIMSAALIWCSALMFLAVGPIISVDGHASTCIQIWTTSTIFVTVSIFSFLLAVKTWNGKPIRHRLMITVRDAIGLSSCVLGPVSLLTLLVWRTKPAPFGRWGKIAMMVGLACWLGVGGMLLVQARSIQLSRNAKAHFDQGNQELALIVAQESARHWKNNLYAKQLCSVILQKQNNTADAIKELSSIIAAVDLAFAYEPALVAEWLADRYIERSALYESIGDSQNAAADTRAAETLKQTQFNVFGYQE
ncbi:MAG: protein kinase [Pirellulales bacterium]